MIRLQPQLFAIQDDVYAVLPSRIQYVNHLRIHESCS